VTKRGAPDRQTVKEKTHGEEDRDLYERESRARCYFYLLEAGIEEAQSPEKLTQITPASSI